MENRSYYLALLIFNFLNLKDVIKISRLNLFSVISIKWKVSRSSCYFYPAHILRSHHTEHAHSMGIYPMFCICFSSPLFVHSSTKLVLLSSKAETTICHFCNSLVPNMIPKIQLVLLYHIQLVPLMQQTPGSQRLFCIIQRKYWGWETNAIISLFYLLEINDCSPGLLSTVQCWQHKHGRIPPFTSFYVIHFSYGQITEQFQMFKLDLEKAVKQEIKLPTRKRRRTPEKHVLSLYWLCQSLFLCGSQQTVEDS